MVENENSNFQENPKTKNKVLKLVILILLVLVLVGLTIGGFYYYVIRINDREIENISNNFLNSFLEVNENDEFKYKDEITYEDLKQKLINEDSLKENTNIFIEINGVPIGEDDNFVFDKIGTYEIKIKLSYEYHFEKMSSKTKTIENENILKINIKDTEKPVISGVQNRECVVGNEINLLDGITVTDNVDENIDIITEGEVDLTKTGEYIIKVIAKDSSGNIAEESFTVTVKEEIKEEIKEENKTEPTLQNNNDNNNKVENNSTSTNNNSNNSNENTSQSTPELNPLSSKEELFKEARKVKSIYRSQINQILTATNGYRSEKGVENLTLNEDLTTAACARAVEMAYSQNLSHTRPDGSSCFTVLSETGISYMTCGENIAWGQSNGTAAASWWKNSSGHYANMVNESFKKIGIGACNYNGKFYWVQLFTN